MRFDLRYGAGSLPLEITGRLTVDTLQPTATEEPIAVERSIIESFERPIDSDSFSHIISKATSFAIVVNGHHDLELNSVLLDSVLESICESISSDAHISVIYPIDSHESGNRLEISEVPMKNQQLVLHDSKSQEDLSFVGETPTYCTPIFVNKTFMDADVKIGLGTIRPDVFVGATGGRMSVLPYCSGIKSISRNSKLQATHPVGPFVTDSAACTDIEEASRLACLDFIINTIPDWRSRLVGIVAGNPYVAWGNGVSLAKRISQSYFQHKADIAIVSSGGSPNDRTFYDAVDTLHAGREVTDHGGVIILVAECPEGPGPDGFVRGVSECSSSKEVSILAETSFEIGMEKSRFFWDILKSRKVIICSRMRESLVTERFHCASVRDPQEGFELAKSMIVSRPRLAVIPDGNRILPVMKNS